MKGLLEGKIAIVTGGTRGIGMGIVKRFIEEGALVILCGSREETATKALQEVTKEYPDAHVKAIWPKLTDKASVVKNLVETDMVKALPKEVIQPIIDHIPLKRMAQPEDIANAFVYLASDMASYVSGEILSVDGAVVI